MQQSWFGFKGCEKELQQTCVEVLFYGCSCVFHLSDNDRRDSHFMGS